MSDERCDATVLDFNRRVRLKHPFEVKVLVRSDPKGCEIGLWLSPTLSTPSEGETFSSRDGWVIIKIPKTHADHEIAVTFSVVPEKPGRQQIVLEKVDIEAAHGTVFGFAAYNVLYIPPAFRSGLPPLLFCWAVFSRFLAGIVFPACHHMDNKKATLLVAV
jgi:hypothetical protein